MNNESGRSLIEMLGVLALAGIVSFGAIAMYRTARLRQTRFIAEQELKTLAENAKIIYSGRQNYTGITKDFLIKTGALKVERIAGQDFRIQSQGDGKTFSIVFENLNMSDCAYFATKRFDWTEAVAVNGFTDNPVSFCAELHPNRLEFIIR